jgi:hypothetical protein
MLVLVSFPGKCRMAMREAGFGIVSVEKIWVGRDGGAGG